MPFRPVQRLDQIPQGSRVEARVTGHVSPVTSELVPEAGSLLRALNAGDVRVEVPDVGPPAPVVPLWARSRLVRDAQGSLWEPVGRVGMWRSLDRTGERTLGRDELARLGPLTPLLDEAGAAMSDANRQAALEEQTARG